MAKLAKVDDLVTRGGFKDIEDLRIVLASHLEASTIHLQTKIRSRFDRVTDFEDFFYIDSEQQPFSTGFVNLRTRTGSIRTEAGMVQIYLRRGFVDPDPLLTFKIERSFELQDFKTGVQVFEIDNDFVNINHERGILTITDSDPAIGLFLEPRIDREFLRVTYTAGFKLKNIGGQDGKVFQNVPDWLEDAAILRAIMMYGLGTGCSREESQKCRALAGGLDALVEPFMRFHPAYRKPMDYP